MSEEKVEVGFKAYMKFVLRDKAAVASIAVIVVLVLAAIYVSTWPRSIAFNYLNNLKYWESTYPATAAPSWMAYLDPKAYAPSIYLRPSSVTTKAYSLSGGQTLYVYNLTYTFSWKYGIPPTDVDFTYLANTTMAQLAIIWLKPSGSTITASISVGSTSATFDLLQAQLQSALTSYLLQKTGITLTTVTTQSLSQVLFNSLSKGSIGPVERGTYRVVVEVVTSSPARLVQDKIRILGNAYGILGTDYYGRPIFLGLLLGLPNALEAGIITSLLSVLIGAFVGGYAGFLGGRSDSFLNWFSTVILALPALPFLVTLGLALKGSLSLMVELLLITFLSWPFYAIIARSSAQSIRTLTFVEADSLMGIPKHTTFNTHFMPRLMPFIVAYTVLGIPGGILLVETLAFIGIAPANLVTWGGILDSAFANNAALNGWWWWILFPGLMIVVVAMPFVVVGFAIERASFGGR